MRSALSSGMVPCRLNVLPPRIRVAETPPASPGINAMIGDQTANQCRAIWATTQSARAASGHPIAMVYDSYWGFGSGQRSKHTGSVV
jgi:hypothetical protein